eukprot:2919043-Rhodomonas_salina.2
MHPEVDRHGLVLRKVALEVADPSIIPRTLQHQTRPAAASVQRTAASASTTCTTPTARTISRCQKKHRTGNFTPMVRCYAVRVWEIGRQRMAGDDARRRRRTQRSLIEAESERSVGTPDSAWHAWYELWAVWSRPGMRQGVARERRSQRHPRAGTRSRTRKDC